MYEAVPNKYTASKVKRRLNSFLDKMVKLSQRDIDEKNIVATIKRKSWFDSP